MTLWIAEAKCQVYGTATGIPLWKKGASHRVSPAILPAMQGILFTGVLFALSRVERTAAGGFDSDGGRARDHHSFDRRKICL